MMHRARPVIDSLRPFTEPSRVTVMTDRVVVMHQSQDENDSEQGDKTALLNTDG